MLIAQHLPRTTGQAPAGTTTEGSPLAGCRAGTVSFHCAQRLALFFSWVARGMLANPLGGARRAACRALTTLLARKARRVMTEGNPCGTGGTTETKGRNPAR